MKNVVLKPMVGDTFTEVCKEAKQKAQSISISGKPDTLVEFDFNGIKCVVGVVTNLELLYRDYKNAFLMGWEKIGPDCVNKYSADLQEELSMKKEEIEKQQAAASKEYREKQDKERDMVNKMVVGEDIHILPGKENEYREYVEKNSKDGYSRGVIDYSEYWAKLMQIEIKLGKTVKEVANECQKNLGFLGISGFMYGCAVNGLSHFWLHGEELRKWHNKEYGHDGEGVVNPAVLTIK